MWMQYIVEVDKKIYSGTTIRRIDAYSTGRLEVWLLSRSHNRCIAVTASSSAHRHLHRILENYMLGGGGGAK
jgi:hypothetical protein